MTQWEALQAAMNAQGERILIQLVSPGETAAEGWTGVETDADGKITASGTDTALTVPSGAVIRLDLNGHTIDRGLTQAADVGFVVLVNGSLSLSDTGTGGGITGGWNRYSGGGVYVSSCSEFIMNGGSITGNRCRYEGGGVFVDSGGTFKLLGGSVTENGADLGGGVSVEHGTCVANHGTIAKNSAAVQGGGGVHIGQGSSFTLSGSAIQDNTTAGRGGGIYNRHGTCSIIGGRITGNRAGSGGGVFNEGTFNLSGSPEIADNIEGASPAGE